MNGREKERDNSARTDETTNERSHHAHKNATQMRERERKEQRKREDTRIKKEEVAKTNRAFRFRGWVGRTISEASDREQE